MAPRIVKASCIVGRTIDFRDAQIEHASFIVGLRNEESRSRFISKSPTEVSAQVKWLENYKNNPNEAYFLIFDKLGIPLGTVRLYDPVGNSFCWGSWVLKSGTAPHVAIESALMIYSYALDYLGFTASHFDVRKDNERVWRFHMRFGAILIGSTELDYLFTISKESILASMLRYRRFLPDPIRVSAYEAN